MDSTAIILGILIIIVAALAFILLFRFLASNKLLNEVNSEKVAMKSELDVTRRELTEARKRLDEARTLEVDRAELLQKLSNAEERLGERDDVEKRFKDTFEALSSKVLKSQQESIKANSEESLKARQEAIEKLVKPLSEKIETLDKARIANASEFRTQMLNLTQANKELASGAQTLSDALRRPDVRGRWGEMQLERVLELSGLEKDIDYKLQPSINVEDGRLRPDVIVQLPQERQVILDSKVSLSALMEAFEAQDEASKLAAFDRHVMHVKSHVDELAKKEYWNLVTSTPPFVVMVLPEFAFQPAIEREPSLTERALEKNVIIVTPPALLALLKAVEMSWQQVKVAKTAKQISDLGKEMYDRLSVFAQHYIDVGKFMGQAIDRYNRGVRSWDRRVATSAQKFKELKVSVSKDFPKVSQIESGPSSMQKLTDGFGPDEVEEVDEEPS